MNHKILIIEDDAKIADMMGNYLRSAGYLTEHIADGDLALQAFQNTQPHVVLLDVMLPNLDGIEICKLLRQTSSVPIIMVTAKVEEVDRLLGLEIGADDYICKPFSPRELVARIKALLRRAQASLAADPYPQGFALHEEALRLSWQGKQIALTPVEFRLFKLLFAKPSYVFSRLKILDALHDDYRDTSDRVIDSHIKNIRKKFEASGAPAEAIASVYGAGYRFEMPA